MLAALCNLIRERYHQVGCRRGDKGVQWHASEKCADMELVYGAEQHYATLQHVQLAMAPERCPSVAQTTQVSHLIK
jgi:hypothetical protein